MRGLRPKVLNSKLNQTTSGFSCWNARRSRIELAGLSNDQQRWTEKPSSSGLAGDIWSARIVRLRNELR
jgi:hypothetical protein